MARRCLRRLTVIIALSITALSIWLSGALDWYLLFGDMSGPLACWRSQQDERGSGIFSATHRSSPSDMQGKWNFGRFKRNSEASAQFELHDNVTIVTAYFKLPEFRKGRHRIYNSDMYLKWMKPFGKINNRVMAYFDDFSIADIFRKLRSSLPEDFTKIKMVNRNNLTSFSLREQIENIIHDPCYPKYEPNTVISQYPMIMHSKYELMAEASTLNPFHTKYMAWVDIGLFSFLDRSQSPFWLYIPENFDGTNVAYGEVFPMVKITPQQIFLEARVWVCGCFFIAQTNVMTAWANEYLQYAIKYLQEGLTNTDEQVLYSMQRDAEKPRIKIDAYKNKGRLYYKLFCQIMGVYCAGETYHDWFFLSQFCMEAGQKKLESVRMNI